ncbi:hypothetical protein SD80_021540 [Scytonema tolypothrichoides VB-61278]|nr:hypothetical protein SD80_021540 [Scytonema tolypothrichoides VB-61278]
MPLKLPVLLPPEGAPVNTSVLPPPEEALLPPVPIAAQGLVPPVRGLPEAFGLPKLVKGLPPPAPLGALPVVPPVALPKPCITFSVEVTSLKRPQGDRSSRLPRSPLD